MEAWEIRTWVREKEENKKRKSGCVCVVVVVVVVGAGAGVAGSSGRFVRSVCVQRRGWKKTQLQPFLSKASYLPSASRLERLFLGSLFWLVVSAPISTQFRESTPARQPTRNTSLPRNVQGAFLAVSSQRSLPATPLSVPLFSSSTMLSHPTHKQKKTKKNPPLL